MFKNLVRTGAQTCVEKGRRVLARLLADPRLAEAATEMQAAQQALETKLTAFEDARAAARTAEAVRDESCRNLENRLREFGLNVLSVTRNHHDADLYLRYFPDGYGDAIHQKPPEMLAFAAMVLGKLQEETDAWVIGFRDRITEARDALVASEESHETAQRTKKETSDYLVAERRLWLRGLVRARLKAQAACQGEEPYLRAIFLPAQPKRGSGSTETPEPEVPAETAMPVIVPITPAETPAPAETSTG